MKKGTKSSKSLLIIVIAYCCVVLVVASFLLSSGAKYRAKINGQTQMKVAELNAAVLESLTKKDGGTEYLPTALGSHSDLQLWNLYPGMPAREYAFIVANGTDTDMHATVDLEFSVHLRTMENVPLKYTLICGENEYPSQPSPHPVSIVDEHALTSDTDWHEYTFYESDSSAREAYFRITSTDLSMVSLKIKVEWPITDTNVVRPTNAACYMDEVEIVNVLIKVNSAKYYYDVPVTPVMDDEDVTSIAAIVLMPNLTGGALNATSTDVTYNATYDAFRLVDGQYRYDFELSNGNPMYKNGINVTTYTDYTVSVQMPVSYFTQSVTPNLIYRDDNDTELELTPAETKYVKYDLLKSSSAYGSFVSIDEDDVPTYVAATDTDLQYRIYKIMSYNIPAGSARLINRHPSETDLSYTAYDTDLLTLVFAASDTGAQKLIVGNPADGIDTVLRRFSILVTAVYSDDE